MLHRLRAERALGKPLPPNALVHHADGSTRDDAPLVICQDMAYHCLLHCRMRILRAGGDPNREKICNWCQRLKPFELFHKAERGYAQRQGRCKECVCVLNLGRKRSG